MKWIYLLLILCTATLKLHAQALQLHLLVNKDDVVYFYTSAEPRNLRAEYVGSPALMEWCKQHMKAQPGAELNLKAFPETPYESLNMLMEDLRFAGYGERIRMRHVTTEDLALLATFTPLPQPPGAEQPRQLVFLIAPNKLCWYLSERYPHVECDLSGKDRTGKTEILLGDYNERDIVVAITRDAELEPTRWLLGMIRDRDLTLYQMRNFTTSEYSTLGVKEVPLQERNTWRDAAQDEDIVDEPEKE